MNLIIVVAINLNRVPTKGARTRSIGIKIPSKLGRATLTKTITVDDGYQIVYTLLPSKQAVQFAKSAPYGPFIVLAIFFLLPFLGQLSGTGNLFIFHIPQYIWLGSLYLMRLVTGSLIVDPAIFYFLA